MRFQKLMAFVKQHLMISASTLHQGSKQEIKNIKDLRNFDEKL